MTDQALRDKRSDFVNAVTTDFRVSKMRRCMT